MYVDEMKGARKRERDAVNLFIISGAATRGVILLAHFLSYSENPVMYATNIHHVVSPGDY